MDWSGEDIPGIYSMTWPRLGAAVFSLPCVLCAVGERAPVECDAWCPWWWPWLGLACEGCARDDLVVEGFMMALKVHTAATAAR